MVNVGLSPSSLVGIALVIAGAGLYFLRSFRPGLARDHDIFFAAVALLCGGILFFQGWRQDPILQFGQFLLTGSAFFFAFESIRLRGVATEQAKRTTPIVDDDRPISRVYRAELDDLTALEERPTNPRRIPGTRSARSSDVDEYGDEVRRRPSSRSSNNERLASGDRPRKRRPRPSDDRPQRSEERSVWDEVDETPTRSSRDDAPARPSRNSDYTASRPKRNRPPQGASSTRRRNNPESPTSDYVDYQPIDYSDDEADNSSNFD